MNNKKWVKIVIIISLINISIVGSINYFVDPLWNFSHKNNFNSIQEGFDERQQKTNLVQFKNMNFYKGVLLGSSRATHINQNDFEDMKIFNYALASMFPYEYKGYIDFFKKNKEEELDYIIIAADFYGINTPKDVKFENPEFYISKSESIGYRYRMLFSIDGLKKSISNVRSFYSGKNEYYDRNNIKYEYKVSEQERLIRYAKNLKRHTETFIGDKYVFNNDYISIYKSLIIDNPQTKVIVFTSPVTADLLVSIIKNADKLKEYKEWLYNIINIFGEVHQYMDINTITTNLQNYPDDDHYYDFIATLLANKIAGVQNDNIPKDFGIVLNKSNIDEYLIKFENKLRNYKNPLEMN